MQLPLRESQERRTASATHTLQWLSSLYFRKRKRVWNRRVFNAGAAHKQMSSLDAEIGRNAVKQDGDREDIYYTSRLRRFTSLLSRCLWRAATCWQRLSICAIIQDKLRLKRILKARTHCSINLLSQNSTAVFFAAWCLRFTRKWHCATKLDSLRVKSVKHCVSGTKCPNETSVGVGELMQWIMRGGRFFCRVLITKALWFLWLVLCLCSWFYRRIWLLRLPGASEDLPSSTTAHVHVSILQLTPDSSHLSIHIADVSHQNTHSKRFMGRTGKKC